MGPHKETPNGAVAAGHNAPITRSRVLRPHSRPTIHSLPLELLSEIFIFVLPTDQEIYTRLESYDNEEWELINPTLVFCAVCSSWRFLAFSTPRLWNRIHIHVPRNINEAQARRKAANLVQWISRSRSLPLTLHVSGHYNICSLAEKNAEALIISVINDYAARWESWYSQDFTLSSSSFRVNGWHSLRRLSYPCSDLVSCANEIVPWAHLTHLHIRDYMACQDATMIFMKCPKLVYLSIMVFSSTIEQITVPIILQDLAIFYLKPSAGAANLQTILRRLSLPSLHTFSISEISSGDIESLSNLFTRSSCTLDRLDICAVNLTSRDYTDVLAHSSCDSLTSLSIRPLHVPIDEEMLRRLTLRLNDTICSHLSSLTINYRIPASSFSAVLNMVKSRIGSRSVAGQVPAEPRLQYLQLNLKCFKKNLAELEEVGGRSGMEYSRKVLGRGGFSVRFRRQGFGEPPNFTELFWS